MLNPGLIFINNMKTKHGRSPVNQDYNDSKHITAHEAELLECYAKLRAVMVTTYYVQMKEAHFVFLINAHQSREVIFLENLWKHFSVSKKPFIDTFHF